MKANVFFNKLPVLVVFLFCQHSFVTIRWTNTYKRDWSTNRTWQKKNSLLGAPLALSKLPLCPLGTSFIPRFISRLCSWVLTKDEERLHIIHRTRGFDWPSTFNMDNMPQIWKNIHNYENAYVSMCHLENNQSLSRYEQINSWVLLHRITTVYLNIWAIDVGYTAFLWPPVVMWKSYLCAGVSLIP